MFLSCHDLIMRIINIMKIFDTLFLNVINKDTLRIIMINYIFALRTFSTSFTKYLFVIYIFVTQK
jgi:hypothetical protein